MQFSQPTVPNLAISSSPCHQSLLQHINAIEQYTVHTRALNSEIEIQLVGLVGYREQLNNRRSVRRKEIKEKMGDIGKDLEERYREIRGVRERLEMRLIRAEEQLNKKIQLPIPHYRYQYIINRVPQYLQLVSERIDEVEQSLKKQNAKRQEELRTLKIRISLAEIELKELKNRSKRK